jgi:hypothetical protein
VGRPGELEGVLLDGGPITGDNGEEAEADRIEDGRPEVFERAGRGEDGVDDEVDDEEDNALEIDDEELAGQGGDCEEDGAEEENLDDGDVEECVEVPMESAGGDAGVIGPGSESAGGFTEDQAEEDQDGGEEGAYQRPPR